MHRQVRKVHTMFKQSRKGTSLIEVLVAMLVLVYVVVGGLGKLSGAIIGTFILVLLQELLIPLKEYELLIYAVIFFLVIRFMSEGIVGTVQNLLNRRRLVGMEAAEQYSQG